ncbi:uncharacterized protein METZ01_LOCUS43724 [marine metagenome]|uniref:Uncharacterized protein n=1 Tax=marine metagenome TaxID=408172 RepID=A0A381RGJ9_9ZZZZ
MRGHACPVVQALSECVLGSHFLSGSTSYVRHPTARVKRTSESSPKSRLDHRQS